MSTYRPLFSKYAFYIFTEKVIVPLFCGFFPPDILRKVVQKEFDLSTDYEKVILIDEFVSKK